MGVENWNVRTRSISIPKRLDERLVEAARQQDRTISRVVVRALKEHLRAEDEQEQAK